MQKILGYIYTEDACTQHRGPHAVISHERDGDYHSSERACHTHEGIKLRLSMPSADGDIGQLEVSGMGSGK